MPMSAVTYSKRLDLKDVCHFVFKLIHAPCHTANLGILKHCRNVESANNAAFMWRSTLGLHY
ncbi:hypothetical protein DM02DRAFT_664538 [Periconia macrospinosa]|uniref:Uncharacterized protein n=1 Tax=Periconia macrospinosa TaxID=97972 RepID=A0A2V1CZ25_9PLEO|nr:hypothetical protein DM02DRAFT_664538 [Periconia macrospinosa]